MSRKTRREKILTQLRRQARLTGGQEKIASGESKPSITQPQPSLTRPQPGQTWSKQYSLTPTTTIEKPTNRELSNNLPLPSKPQNTTGLTSYPYLISDLKRITILTVLTFLFEFAIYFFQEIV